MDKNKKLQELLKNPGPKIEEVIGDKEPKVELFFKDVNKEEVETRESLEARQKDLQKSLRTFEKEKHMDLEIKQQIVDQLRAQLWIKSRRIWLSEHQKMQKRSKKR